MFDDLIKEKEKEEDRMVYCTITGRYRYLFDGYKRCRHWNEYGCDKYLVGGNFNCSIEEN
jgi:hypothetical protein